MSSYYTDRRSVLKIIGSIGATCAYPFAGDELYGQTEEAHAHGSVHEPKLSFFEADDMKLISRVAELIIPETDTPGAIGAGVPVYIDNVVGRSTDQQLLLADGLRWLDTEANRIAQARFFDLTQDQQLSILQPLCDAVDSNSSNARNVEFFGLMKRLTADGYYTSKSGLMEELGYQGNAVRPDFPECVHEH